MLSIRESCAVRSPCAKSWRRGQPFCGSMGLEWIRERRRPPKDAVAERKQVVNPDTGETPAGYNKMLRDCARIALAGASAALLGGWPQIALVASAIAAGLLQQGSPQRPSRSDYGDDVASMAWW